MFNTASKILFAFGLVSCAPVVMSTPSMDELEYKEVSVQGQVAKEISPSAFSISDPDDPGVDPLFILDKSGATDVEPGLKVNVRGIVYLGFDVSEIKQSHGVELNPVLEQEWEGEAYIVASEVDPQ